MLAPHPTPCTQPCCAALCYAVQFTEMVLGGRKAEGVASPRGSMAAAPIPPAFSSKAAAEGSSAPAGANGRAPGQDDTAMVN